MGKNDSMTWVEEVKKMDMKHASLKEDYVKLQKHVRATRRKTVRSKDKNKWLQAEVRFLGRKYKMLTEKNHVKTTDPLVFPESGAKVHSVYRKPKEPTEVLAIEDEPARREFTGINALSLMSTFHCTSPEMTGPQHSPMGIMPAVAVPHSSFVTPVAELAKGDLEKTGFVNAQKPSKVKNGRNRKIKTDLLIPPEYSARSIIISREPIEALAIEDKSARHELTRMQMLSSKNYCSLPEMIGRQSSPMRIMPHFKVPHDSFFTPTVVHSQNEKVKADLSVSPESSAKIISISKQPKGPTQVLATKDESARHELIGMHHSSLITPAVEPANKKRRLENNGLTGTQKPPKVNNRRNKKVKPETSVPEFAAKNIYISRKPKELIEALAIEEDKPARYELTSMQPPLSTDNCTLPIMTGLQPSTMRAMRGSIVPPGSFITRVEPTNKKRPLENKGLVRAQKPTNVKDSWNKKIKTTPVISLECGAKTLICGKPKESIEALPIQDKPARHELTGLQLFSSSNACTSPEMTGLLPSATRMMPPLTVPQGLLVTTIVKPTIRKRKNNGLVNAQKPSEVKGRQRKKTKGSPQKPISHGLVNAQKPSEVKGRQRKKTKGSPQKPVSLTEEMAREIFGTNNNP